MRQIEVVILSPAGLRMMGRLDTYWNRIQEMRAIMQVQGTEVDRLRGAFLSNRNQYFIRRADTGLVLWEKELAIPTDVNKPISERRSVVESKIRGIGTVTRQMLERVAQAYDRGLIRVTEQPELYQITVQFIDTLGTPPNINDLMAALEEIKPAHLTLKYTYRYLRIKEIHNVLTLNQMNSLKLSNFTPGTEG